MGRQERKPTIFGNSSQRRRPLVKVLSEEASGEGACELCFTPLCSDTSFAGPISGKSEGVLLAVTFVSLPCGSRLCFGVFFWAEG